MSQDNQAVSFIPEGMHANDITDLERAKFDSLFDKVEGAHGSFAMTRVSIANVPCTAVVFVPGVSKDQLIHVLDGEQPVTKAVILEMLFVNEGLINLIQNHEGQKAEAVSLEELLQRARDSNMN